MLPVKSVVSTFVSGGLLVPIVASFALAQAPSVRDIPLPQGAADVTYVRSRGDIRYKTSFDMKAMGDFYATQLGQRQWTKAKRDNLQKNFWVQTFAKAGPTIEVRVDARGTGCEVRLTPEGFSWDEDLAPRPKDVPIPDDAKQLEYDDFFERIEFQSAAGPKKLAEFYAARLDPKTWSKPAADTVTPANAQLQRTAGKATVTVAVRRDGDASRVTISTKGMVWDEIKAANAAKKASQTAAVTTADPKNMPQSPGNSGTPNSTATAKNAGSTPNVGPTKPRRLVGVEKLMSGGKLTIAGQTHSLANVTIYETKRFDDVVTAVLLTERPINLAKLQASLAKPEHNDDEFYEFQPQIKLVFDAREQLGGVFIWCDGLSINVSGGDNIQASVVIEEGRVRGTAHTVKPEEAFGKKVEFEASFDGSALRLPAGN